MYEVALIGGGRIGRIHGSNVAAEPRLRLRYIVDPSADAAAAIAGQTGAGTASLDDVLADPEVAGVIVASSTDTHLDYSVRAVQAGKAVFCEKPIDMDLARARAARPVLGNARVFVGFNRRFDPHFARLHDRIASGEMGQLETLHIISHDPAPPPIDYIRVSGGMFKDMSIHDFDMARWLLAEEVTGIFSTASCLVDPAIGEAGDVDTAKTMLRTASGKICLISNSRRSGYGYDQRIEAYCAKGLIRAGNVHETTVEKWGEGGAESDPLQNFFLDRYAAAFRAEMTHFADVIEGKADPLATYEDAVAALALAEGAEQSLSARSIVEPS